MCSESQFGVHSSDSSETETSAQSGLALQSCQSIVECFEDKA